MGDELNRSSPKTQSAFMEAMEEKNISIDGKTFKLPDPFIVIATQNPSDLSGTSLLPESQLDRFMISFALNELNDDEQLKVLRDYKNNFDEISSDKFDLINIQKNKDSIQMNDIIFTYIQNIYKHIRNNFDDIHISSRCLKYIVNISKSLALVKGIKGVTFKEVQEVLPYVLRHRINLVTRKEIDKFIQKEIIEKVALPE